MREILEPGAARSILRREIWRRSRGPLVLVAVVTGLCLAAVGHGVSPFMEAYDRLRAMDGAVRHYLYFVALCLAIVLLRGKIAGPRPRPLLRRLPVDPTAVLQAQLGLALAAGVLVFGAFLLVEYFRQPVMMHPSFAGRLNPAETETLKRLPGVPLLRFTVGGRVTRGLASELTLAALGAGGVARYGTLRRPHDAGRPEPRPGQVVAKLDRRDWPELDDSERSILRQLGVPRGAPVEIVLQRYVPEAEYLGQPWRCDGLLRGGRWHLADRAVGFLGLIAVLVCVLNLDRSRLYWMILWALCILPVFPQVITGSEFFDRWRRLVLFSDLGGDLTLRIPTLGVQRTVFENLVWPLVVLAVCCAAYAFTARQIRRAPAGPIRAESLRELLGRHWRGEPARRLEVLGGLLLVLLALGSIGSRLWPDAAAVSLRTWYLAFFLVVIAAMWTSLRWRRRDPLLSRLPVRPAGVARRRFVRTILTFAVLALLPLAVERMAHLAGHPLTGSESGGGSPLGGEGWRRSLLVLAAGILVLFFALLGRSMRGAALGSVVALNVGFLAATLLWYLGATTLLTALGLGVLTVGLPAIYLLIVHRVTAGGVPGESLAG